MARHLESCDPGSGASIRQFWRTHASGGDPVPGLDRWHFRRGNSDSWPVGAKLPKGCTSGVGRDSDIAQHGNRMGVEHAAELSVAAAPSLAMGNSASRDTSSVCQEHRRAHGLRQCPDSVHGDFRRMADCRSADPALAAAYSYVRSNRHPSSTSGPTAARHLHLDPRRVRSGRRPARLLPLREHARSGIGEARLQCPSESREQLRTDGVVAGVVAESGVSAGAVRQTGVCR